MSHNDYPRPLGEVQEELKEHRRKVKGNPSLRNGEWVRKDRALDRELLAARDESDPLGAVAFTAARLHAEHSTHYSVDTRGAVLTGSDIREVARDGSEKEVPTDYDT